MTSSNPRQSLGIYGETLAEEYLLKHNFKILSKRFRNRTGEIDIIAEKQNTVHFIEIKTRVGINKGKPYEAVNKHKLRRMQQVAYFFLLQNKKTGYKLSLDVFSIVLSSDWEIENMMHFIGVTL
ncbi:MAG: YraN family protein [Patescibacteria group bacterium]